MQSGMGSKSSNAVERETGGVTHRQEKTPFESREYMSNYCDVSIFASANNDHANYIRSAEL